MSLKPTWATGKLKTSHFQLEQRRPFLQSWVSPREAEEFQFEVSGWEGLPTGQYVLLPYLPSGGYFERDLKANKSQPDKRRQWCLCLEPKGKDWLDWEKCRLGEVWSWAAGLREVKSAPKQPQLACFYFYFNLIFRYKKIKYSWGKTENKIFKKHSSVTCWALVHFWKLIAIFFFFQRFLRHMASFIWNRSWSLLHVWIVDTPYSLVAAHLIENLDKNFCHGGTVFPNSK